MMYHYFGNKEELFRIVLEDAYGDFRAAEAKLELDRLDPVEALKTLVAFTWKYYLDNPEFITLVNSENLHKARHIKDSGADAGDEPPLRRTHAAIAGAGRRGGPVPQRARCRSRSTSPSRPSAITISPTVSPDRSSSSAT